MAEDEDPREPDGAPDVARKLLGAIASADTDLTGKKEEILEALQAEEALQAARKGLFLKALKVSGELGGEMSETLLEASIGKDGIDVLAEEASLPALACANAVNAAGHFIEAAAENTREVMKSSAKSIATALDLMCSTGKSEPYQAIITQAKKAVEEALDNFNKAGKDAVKLVQEFCEKCQQAEAAAKPDPNDVPPASGDPDNP